jgi:hypothetical protein
MNLHEQVLRMKKMMNLNENVEFNNWIIPSEEKLKLEYHVEIVLKRNDFFNTLEEFLDATENGVVKTVTRNDEDNDDTINDYKIEYRSRTTNKDSLLGLIKSYRSYPEFRNEKTVEAIYDGFKNNSPMEYPIVLKFPSGKYRILSGNTRMDVAFQLGINPKVLVINTNNF